MLTSPASAPRVVEPSWLAGGFWLSGLFALIFGRQLILSFGTVNVFGTPPMSILIVRWPKPFIWTLFGPMGPIISVVSYDTEIRILASSNIILRRPQLVSCRVLKLVKILNSWVGCAEGLFLLVRLTAVFEIPAAYSPWGFHAWKEVRFAN